MKVGMKIKVCGMRDVGNISGVAALHPDFMGFIFYAPSPRNCIGLDPGAVRSLPEGVEAVAVFVDEDYEKVMEIVREYGFRTVQLHGKESPAYCSRLRREGIRVMKTVSVKDEESLRAVARYEGCVDMFVFDTASPSKGGCGKKFDWSLLENAHVDTDFLLSGGIGPADAEAVLAFRHLRLAGVDLNSRFETAPGLKDVSVLKNFLKYINYESFDHTVE